MSIKDHGMKSGFPWIPALTILFIGLKLSGQIDWSWWWVLSPVWISLALALALVLLVVVIDSVERVR